MSTIAEIRDKCVKIDEVSQVDMDAANQRFNMMGAVMPDSNWDVELKAFRQLQEGFKKGYMIGYW